MAKQSGPKCRLCRREGTRLFLKGTRCLTQKCAMVRKNYIPGHQGTKARKGRLSEYALHLREKQKLRRMYGILERQFRKYYKQAASARGVSGDNLFQILESRLDNLLYRAGFASSRAQGRQFVNHGLFRVNKRKVNIPSYQVKKGDKVRMTARAAKNRYFKNLQLPPKPNVSWIEVNKQDKSIEIIRKPTTQDVDQSIDMALIVEYYSR